MAAGPQETDQSAVVKTVDSESVNNSNNNNKNGSVSDSKTDIKMKDFVDMLSSLKLNPMAEEFFPSSYSPIDRNRDQSEIPISYFMHPTAFFKNFPENGIDGYTNNRRV